MLAMVRRRHMAVSKAGFPRWVYAEHVHSLRWGSEADAIALDGLEVPWGERPCDPDSPTPWGRVAVQPDVHGYEVKISRSDWLREHRTEGRKSLPWRQHCSHWWIVVPDVGVVRREELPDGWGLLVGRKRLRAEVRARRESRKEVPHEVLVTVARQAIKTDRVYWKGASDE